MNRLSKGFTLVEVLVVLPMMLIIIAGIGALLVTYYTDLSETTGKIELQLDSQLALFSARDDLFYAVRFAGSPQPDVTDANAPAGGWNAIEDGALIVYEAAYTKNRQSTDRLLIYKQNTPNDCLAEDVIENQYSTNTLIYFVKDNVLYRRTLVPNQSANCSSTYRTQTCPAAVASETCPADLVIAKNVGELNITYYSRDAGDSVFSEASLQANPDTFIQIARADVELTLEKMINAEPVQSKAKINIKKIE